MKHVLAPLLIAILAAPAEVLAGPRLSEWLAALPDARLDRAAPELVAWRRKHPDLIARLTGFARDPSHPRALRAGSVRALAALADAPEQIPSLAGDLAPLVQAARARAAQRALARRHLATSARAPERLAEVAKGLSPACGLELLDLALDPLLAAAQRPVALKLIAARGGASLDAALPRLLAAPHLQPREVLGPILTVLAEREELIPTVRRLFQAARVPSGAKAKLARWLGERKVTGAVNAIRRLERRPELTRSDRADAQVALLLLDPRSRPAYVPKLVEHALAADDAVADTAIRGLARIKPAGLGPHLIKAFQVRDPGGARRVRALQLAELLGVAELSGRLGKLLLDAEQPLNVRQAAAHALGTLASKNELRPLINALTGTRTERAALRRETADAIARAARRAPPPAFLLSALEEALPREPEPTVRVAILRALGAIGASSSRAALRRLITRRTRLGAREARVALETARRLAMVDRDSARALLALRARDRDDEALGLATVRYVHPLRPGLAVPALLSLLADRSPRVAAAALGELIRRWPASKRVADERTPPGDGPVAPAIRARWAARWSKAPGTFR